MKTRSPNLLGAIVRDYFTDHLPGLRGSSPHTIHSYRDSIVLLLRFLSGQRKKPVTGLDLTDLDPPGIIAFLSHLEQERHNGVYTRNVRLSAIHAFFRFVASRNPEHLDLAQRVLGIPFKRAQQRVIDYLEYEEIDSVLKAIDRTTPQGNRDYALLATMFNTGARVQEVLDLRVRDLRLDAPSQIRLMGKGNKTRLCPLWPVIGRLLRGIMAEAVASSEDPASRLLFTNARDRPLTRYGVRYLLRRYLKKAARLAPTLRDKRLHPHSLRHSTAVALLKAGVDFATISQWLGHAGLNTTMRYARADIDLKRQALSQVFPDALAPPRGGRLLIDGSDLVGWLRRI